MLHGLFWLFLGTTVALSRCQSIIEVGSSEMLDAVNTLECHRRTYTYRVTQTDENGKQCWDTLSVLACWGRCDSNEVCLYLYISNIIIGANLSFFFILILTFLNVKPTEKLTLLTVMPCYIFTSDVHQAWRIKN